MLALRKKLTPQQEAQRQIEIAQEHERLRDVEAARLRDLAADNMRRRQMMWAEKERVREEKRLGAAAAVAEREREKRDRQREQEAVRNEAKMTEYKAAREAFDSVKRELDALNIPHDLSTPEGLAAATEQKLRATALRELLAQADRRLLAAERAIGRHRAGRA